MAARHRPSCGCGRVFSDVPPFPRQMAAGFAKSYRQLGWNPWGDHAAPARRACPAPTRAARETFSSAAQHADPRKHLVVPRHVGIIMDGNSRWATQRGMAVQVGRAMAVMQRGASSAEPAVDLVTVFRRSSAAAPAGGARSRRAHAAGSGPGLRWSRRKSLDGICVQHRGEGRDIERIARLWRCGALDRVCPAPPR